MELKIESNRYIYYNEFKSEDFFVKLNGDLKYNVETKINVYLNNNDFIRFNNTNSLHQFSEEIRGKSKDAFLYCIIKREIESSPSFRTNFEKLNEFTFNSFKSIFLLYYWLEMPLINEDISELDIYKSLFDNFVVDWTFRPESQKDIYLIKKSYIKSTNEGDLEHLLKINLLLKFTVSKYRGEEIISYFTPLNQLGISKDLFEYIDNSGNIKSAHPLWKSILADRDMRLSKWANNRY